MKLSKIKKLGKAKEIFFIFLFSFVLPFFCFFVINEFVLNPATFASGTTICGVDVGNLDIEQAKQKLSMSEPAGENVVLELNYGDKKWTFIKTDFEVKSNIHFVIDEMQKSQNSGLSSKKLVKKIKRMGFSNETAVTYALKGLDEKIDKISAEIEEEPVCAKAVFTASNFNILPSHFGLKVNKDKLYSDIYSSLSNKFSPITIETQKVTPEFVEEDIKRATKQQSVFSTTYSSSSYGRKNNINLATSALNNTEILPNKTFSFNDIVGRRSLENGYKPANIIKDGSFVKGVGGGICQVSTTLYNALLHANITVTEAHKHSLPVSYVKPGLDAMVSWGGADLKFTNETNLPIYISSFSNNEKITFKIYGNTNPDNLVLKTRSEIIKTINAPKDKIIADTEGKYAEKIMFKGEFIREKASKNGYEVQTFIDCYAKDGTTLLSTKSLRHATYEPQQGVLYEGCETLPKSLTLPSDKKKSNIDD
jgi:vancomycin resistance protein YoaR